MRDQFGDNRSMLSRTQLDIQRFLMSRRSTHASVRRYRQSLRPRRTPGGLLANIVAGIACSGARRGRRRERAPRDLSSVDATNERRGHEAAPDHVHDMAIQHVLGAVPSRDRAVSSHFPERRRRDGGVLKANPFMLTENRTVLPSGRKCGQPNMNSFFSDLAHAGLRLSLRLRAPHRPNSPSPMGLVRPRSSHRRPTIRRTSNTHLQGRCPPDRRERRLLHSPRRIRRTGEERDPFFIC